VTILIGVENLEESSRFSLPSMFLASNNSPRSLASSSLISRVLCLFSLVLAILWPNFAILPPNQVVRSSRKAREIPIYCGDSSCRRFGGALLEQWWYCHSGSWCWRLEASLLCVCFIHLDCCEVPQKFLSYFPQGLLQATLPFLIPYPLQ
jgi:hypothetical protein